MGFGESPEKGRLVAGRLLLATATRIVAERGWCRQARRRGRICEQSAVLLPLQGEELVSPYR
ncbi:hypothetical protein CSW58_12075 [Caulobacter sp. B11]|nr:hypothetical protein CSW58_12075 [Caulobacter sp. B11]